MINLQPMNVAERNDAELVAESLNGNREAFRHIVERYKTLICSLAYNGTGSVSQSEDVAQETFLTAWTDLRSLREPDKLRSWLCGIVRNRVHRKLRNDGREPVVGAAALEDAAEAPAREALPSDEAVRREEETILWRSLERVPELYREPLILYYRHHQSIEQVAEELDLTEDAVKQRLSRGRKFLQDEVQAFVENTLQRTAPGQAFSGVVLSALPLAAGPGAAAGLATGAKGGAAAKSGLLATMLAPLAPVAGIAAGVATQFLVINAETTDRSARTKKMLRILAYWTFVIGVAWVGEYVVGVMADYFKLDRGMRFASFAVYWWVYLCVLIGCTRTITRHGLRLRLTGETVSASGAKPLNGGTLALVVAGVHLTLFFALVRVAWNANDHLGACIIAGAAVVLAIVAFFRIRGKTGVAEMEVTRGHFGLCFAVMMLSFNCRIDVWVAAAQGVSVAEAREIVPIWIVPVLTLALAAWTGFVLARIRRANL